MMTAGAYIESGILETYLLGLATPEEAWEVEQMAAAHTEVREALDKFSEELEQNALANATTPGATIRPMLTATVDYTERLKNGEVVTFPPVLHDASKPEDYEEWLSRPDMVLPEHFTDLHAKIIGYTPRMTTVIVWINEMAPSEIHDDELESFLIVEGSCEIVIGEEVHNLVPGDYLSIPLYQPHFVKVTSAIPCKVILQRVAA